MKKTLVIDGADFDGLNNPIVKSNSDPLPDIRFEEVCNLIPCHLDSPVIRKVAAACGASPSDVDKGVPLERPLRRQAHRR